VKSVIDAVLSEKLTGKEYAEDDAKEWSIEICEDVKAAVKGASAVSSHFPARRRRRRRR
jgi:hypothetical protein